MGNVVFRFSFIVLLGLTVTSAMGFGQSHAMYEELLKQAERPTVLQVMELVQAQRPVPLQVHSELPKEKNVKENLHYNYPHWFNLLIAGAPRMIATFEQAFPGATWAFIGRDMAILADLFEAFYIHLGQKNRVVRIDMSSPVVKNGLDPVIVLDFLQSHGLEFGKKMTHPYIFVDAISRNSGTQGRNLLNAIYNSRTTWKSLGLSNYSQLPWFINMIGLKVYTTSLESTDFSRLSEILVAHQGDLKEMPPGMGVFGPENILVYDDGREKGTYEGINEAGYTHWTGAWHNSFESWVRTGNGVIAVPGAPSSPEVRSAVLDFQANVIESATSNLFLEKVKSAAKERRYIFPLTRSNYEPETLDKVLSNIRLAKSEAETLAALSSFSNGSLGSFPGMEILDEIKSVRPYLTFLNWIKDSMKKAELVDLTSETFLSWNPSISEIEELVKISSLKTRYTLLAAILTKTRDASHFVKTVENMAALHDMLAGSPLHLSSHQINCFFRNTAPQVTDINSLVRLFISNTQLHEQIIIQAFRHINTVAEYNSLIKPKKASFFSRLSKEYRLAKYEVKKRLKMTTFLSLSDIL